MSARPEDGGAPITEATDAASADAAPVDGAGGASSDDLGADLPDAEPADEFVSRVNRILLWALVLVSVVVLGVLGFVAWDAFMRPEIPRSAVEQDLYRSRGAVERAPDDPLARVEYASALYRMGEVQDAIRELEVALEIQPGHPSALYNLAVIHWYNGQPDKAVDELRALVERSPGDQAAWFRLGAFLEERKDWKGAAEAFGRAVELKPGDVAARVRFGRALENSDKHEEARAQYEAALEYVPDYKPALEALEAIGR